MAIDVSRKARSALFYALRLAFRLTPMTLATRDRLRQRFLDHHADLVPESPSGIAPLESMPRRPYARSDERAIGYVPYSKGDLPDPLPATLVAFYLPQFHTIPENDEWWGKGFTEWRNVTRALPQFEGHQQPRLPGELGFYDLRNPQIMREQARLAAEYGLSAFCFYFYWFGGKTLLESPLEQWLKDDSITLSYCLCWANENWSRRWDGRSEDILIKQEHSAEDDLAFIEHVSKYLRDPRYLRVEGEPLLLVYRPDLLPSPKETAIRWRQWCRDNGIGEIRIAYVQGFERPDPRELGFDAAVEFPPNLSNPPTLAAEQSLINPDFKGQVLDWHELAADYSTRPMPSYPLYPGVNTGWDNEPRRPGQGRVYLHASPRGYGDWLKATINSRLSGKPRQDRLVFINAWNEWAEGAVLEPDARGGYAYLAASRRALLVPHSVPCPSVAPCVVIHAWYPDVFQEILQKLLESGVPWRVVVTTTPQLRGQVADALKRFPMQSEIHVAENRGRDILPFLRVASVLHDEGVHVVLKLHTKKSPHREDGEQWRRDLIDKLLGGSRASRALEAFATQDDLGLVGPEGHIQRLDSSMGSNSANVAFLATAAGIPKPNPDAEDFIAGSMFWIRLGALVPLLDAQLTDADFVFENNQLDGTLAHAVERVFLSCVRAAGFRAVSGRSLDADAAAPDGTAGRLH